MNQKATGRPTPAADSDRTLRKSRRTTTPAHAGAHLGRVAAQMSIDERRMRRKDYAERPTARAPPDSPRWLAPALGRCSWHRDVRGARQHSHLRVAQDAEPELEPSHLAVGLRWPSLWQWVLDCRGLATADQFLDCSSIFQRASGLRVRPPACLAAPRIKSRPALMREIDAKPWG